MAKIPMPEEMILNVAGAVLDVEIDGKTLREWIDILKEYRSSGWISVEDRLPEIFTNVMVYTDRYGGRIEFAHIGIHGWSHNGAILIPNVTHWMPLPEPPTNGGKEHDAP